MSSKIESSPPSARPVTKWQVPIVVIVAVIMWIAVTFIKWHLRRAKEQKYRLNNKKLEEMLKFRSASGKTGAEALKAFHARQLAEEEEKISKSRGKTLVDEIEERRQKKGKKSRKYTAEMFEDSVSLLHNEIERKKKGGNKKDEDGDNKTATTTADDKGHNSSKTESAEELAAYRRKDQTKTRHFITGMNLSHIQHKKKTSKKD